MTPTENENITLIEFQSRIQQLRSLDLCKIEILEVKKSVQNYLHIPSHIFPQVEGSVTYRALTSKSNIPFETKDRISYNPKLANHIGRANLIGESVFYSSSSLETAAIEACQNELQASKKKDFYVTVGEWGIQRKLAVNVVCHSKIAQQAGTDLIEAAKSIDKMMREGRTEEEYQIFLLESRFFSDQFAKSKIICANDYLFSAICASQILNHPEIDCDGIWYPSVAYKYRGFNSVYKPSLIDAGVIQLRHVFFIRLLFYDDRYPQVRYLRDTLRFDKNRIIW